MKIILFFLLTAVSTYSQDIEPRIYKNAASQGMGGVGVSSFGYEFSAYRNPAALGLMADYDIIPFASVGGSVNPEMIKVLQEVKSYASGKDSVTTLDFNSLINKGPSLYVNGPLNVGFLGKGFGAWLHSSAKNTITFRDNPAADTYINGVVSGAINGIFETNIESNIDTDLSEFVSIAQDIIEGSKTNDELAELLENSKFGSSVIELIGDSYDATATDEQIRCVFDKIIAGLDTNDAIDNIIPQARMDLIAEITANVAYGYKIPFAAMDNVSGLSLGAAVRYVQRFKMTSDTGNGTKGFINLSNLYNDYGDILANVYQAGIITSDFGMSLRLENFVLGAAVRDALSTTFHWESMTSDGTINDSYFPMSVDFGASYRFYFNNRWIQEAAFYLEFENATCSLITWANKTRAGAGIKLFGFLDLRMGVYDSFITAGVGMSWKWFRMDFAYYRDDYWGIYTSDQYYFNMTFGFDNTPKRKNASLQRQREYDREQNTRIIDNSLQGL